ncbi:uncharacterized protein EKO05_0005716 [Ascochyta rabiei]|uniref:Uncharacterized protein n=1 Tax=Didymella rabiei TaxID=5454 RepID=A0A163HEZ6_DIDRA|nr:uncharacterized protein EKO05_0005716 [Ascochyta rabiei]KZM25261.1 hypothetical protein ST47_g3591 [Ascochyta rabiei]UPX15261.1 hypothetical protein EKO05_0005716 [Ascochyta rabiei]
MKASWAAIGALLSFVHQSSANLDFITLPAPGNSWIQEAVATLVLGDVPSNNQGDVALWSAIMMDKQDFLQGVTQNSANSPWCQNLGQNWCNFAYTLVGSSTVTNGTPVKAKRGDRVRTHYKLNSQTQLWDQDLYVNDKLASHVSTSKGQHGRIFYVSIECASGSCPMTPAHSWENISVTLNKADQSFKHAGAWAHGATGGAMSTTDGGKTWNFSKLNIPAIVAA